MMIRLFDMAVSALILVLASPFIAGGLLLSALSIGLPPVFISRRRGRYGKPFRHFKIKTMLPGIPVGRAYMEQERLNRVGRLIRRFHVDELLEFLLVLSGKMSVVGPRPLPNRFLARFDTARRDTVPPGITCLAQLTLLRKGFLAGPEQIFLDNVYVGKRSMHYNLRIIFATIRVVMRPGRQITDTAYNDYRRSL